MGFPSIPNTPIQALIVIGIGLVIAAVLQPTELYEQWEDAEAERAKQVRILEIEEAYVEDETDPAILRLKMKELEIQRAEVEWLETHAANLRGRWAKARQWALVGGTGGLVAFVCGMWIWWRRHPNGNKGP
jgi:hypothetical protein